MPRDFNWRSWDALHEVAAKYRKVIDEPGKYGHDGAKHLARAEGWDLLRVYQIMHVVKTFTREQFEAHPNLYFAHWLNLSKIAEEGERAFYLHMVAKENWSVQELCRAIQDVHRVRRLLKLMKRFVVKRQPPDSGTAG